MSRLGKFLFHILFEPSSKADITYITIPLEKARLCVNCNVIHIKNSCPKCSSEIFIVLSNVLGDRGMRFDIRFMENPLLLIDPLE